jgi:hypothetical protein
MMKSEPLDDPEFSWWEKAFEARNLTASLGEALNNVGAGTTLTLDITDRAYLVPKGAILRVPSTGEYLRVSVDPTSDTQITAIRGVGQVNGTAVPAIPVGAQISVIGTAHEEGSGTPSSVARVPTKRSNYTQIFKTSTSHTRTMRKTRTRTGNQVAEDRMEVLQNHMQDIERSAIFGKKSEIVGPDGQPLRTSDGLISVINTNVDDFGGNGTFAGLKSYLKQLFKYGKKERMAYCGNDFVSKLTDLISDQVQFTIGDTLTVYGQDFETLKTPFGTVRFMTHPLLNEDNYFSNAAFFLSPENMVYRYIDDTDLYEDVQQNGFDKKDDMYLTECGFEIHLEETHGFLMGL